MTTYTHKLEFYRLDASARVRTLRRADAAHATMDDPAISVMTDLRQVRAVTVNPDAGIDFALDLMKHAGVRMLVVVDDQQGLLGLVTARDITGEKPMEVMTRERLTRRELRVAQVMTPRSQIDPFNIRDVEHATVRDVVLKMRHVGRQHALVIERQDDDGDYLVRGIFSITQIGRQLGVEISTAGHVQTFADFERLIA